MPRDGSGVYSAPAGTTATPNTTIESSKYNALVADLVSDANAARPVTAGGTGATSVSAARTALAVPGLVGANTFTGSQTWAEGAAIASASTLTLGTDGNFFHVTGTTTITAISGDASPIMLVFDGALTLTHNGTSLILPGAANITTAAGDTAIFVSEGSGNWRCLAYQKADATPLKAATRLITSGTVAAGASLDLTSVFTSDYSYYVLELDDCLPATDSAQLYLRLHDGSSFRSGASDYKYAGMNVGVGLGITESPSSAADTKISITGNSQGNAAGGEELQGRIYFNNPKGSGRYPTIDWEVTYGAPDLTIRKVSGSGQLAANAPVQGAQLYYSSGNIATMRYWLYGMYGS